MRSRNNNNIKTQSANTTDKEFKLYLFERVPSEVLQKRRIGVYDHII